MSQSIVGNVGYVKAETAPANTSILWGKILNPMFPDIVELHVHNNGLWVSIMPAFTLGLYFEAPCISILQNPPGSPATGARYLIQEDVIAGGAWAGRNAQIAEWNGSAWEYTECQEGTLMYILSRANQLWRFDQANASWRAYEFNLEAKKPNDSAEYVAASNGNGVLHRVDAGKTLVIEDGRKHIVFEELVVDGDVMLNGDAELVIL